jgi:nicotinate-nucleotide adenylyltransferase
VRTAAFFGGSFNPPHVAHEGFVRTLLEMKEIDEVWVVPCGEHMFGKSLAPFEDRLCMCRLAFGRLQGVVISEIENSLPQPNKTYDTLKVLEARFADLRFRLAVGADILAEKNSWYRYADIEREFFPVVLPRNGYNEQNFVIGQDPFLGKISSSSIRRALAKCEDVSEWLSPEVTKFIFEHKLYSSNFR